jgi:hypothetical protein
MGCPAFSNATAASLTVSASFAREARTMSQQIFCAVLKTTPRPHQIIRTENVDLCSKKGRRMISQRRFLFVLNFIFLTLYLLELYLLGALFSLVTAFYFSGQSADKPSAGKLATLVPRPEPAKVLKFLFV